MSLRDVGVVDFELSFILKVNVWVLFLRYSIKSWLIVVGRMSLTVDVVVVRAFNFDCEMGMTLA